MLFSNSMLSSSSIFIRNRFYFSLRKRRFKRRKIKNVIKGLSRIKRKIKRKLYKSCYTFKRRPKKRRKALKISFFRRYIFVKKRTLYRRTIGLNIYRRLDDEAENKILMNLRYDIKRYERKRMLNNHISSKINYKLLSARYFHFGRVYLTHCRRNTFLTISKIQKRFSRRSKKRLKNREQVIFKSSCGHQGYIGPKRSTYHARLGVAKAGGNFLAYHEFSSLDIIFPSGVGKIFYRLVKDLCKTHYYVRYFISRKKRSHGHTRKRKLRRL